jgi:hypothetical protein
MSELMTTKSPELMALNHMTKAKSKQISNDNLLDVITGLDVKIPANCIDFKISKTSLFISLTIEREGGAVEHVTWELKKKGK